MATLVRRDAWGLRGRVRDVAAHVASHELHHAHRTVLADFEWMLCDGRLMTEG
jgi:hypothetical protein